MLFSRRTYLDYAAGVHGNPGSPHQEGRASKETLEASRVRLARLLEVKADDIIFTSGATEANALAILGVVRAARAGGVTHPHVLFLESAHASVVENMRILACEGVRVQALPLKGTAVDTEALAKCITEDTVLVSMDAVCGETGVVWNTRVVRGVLDAARVSAKDTAVFLHVDASQSPLSSVCTRSHFGADLLTLDGSKVGTEHRVGCLVAPRLIPLQPLYAGGAQERSLRPGTEDARGAEELARGLEEAQRIGVAFREQSARMRGKLLQRLSSAIAGVQVNESVTQQAPHIVNVSFIGRDTDYLVALLDEAGYAVSTKSACETDSPSGSRAVYALFGDVARAASTLRISWGPGLKASALEAFAEAAVRSVHFVDSAGSR